MRSPGGEVSSYDVSTRLLLSDRDTFHWYNQLVGFIESTCDRYVLCTEVRSNMGFIYVKIYL